MGPIISYNISMKKVIIFDVDGTIADVEHRRHLVNGDKGFKPDWTAFRKATRFDTPVQWVCDIAKDTLPKETKLHSSLQETNQKERLLNYKFLNGLVKVIKEFFLDQMVISDVTQNSNLNSLTNLKKSVVKSTLYLTTEIKLSICGDKEELL